MLRIFQAHRGKSRVWVIRFEQRWNEDGSSNVHRKTVAFTIRVKPGLLGKQRQQRRQQQSHDNVEKTLLKILIFEYVYFDTMIDVTVKKREQRIGRWYFQYWERESVQNPKINWEENSRVEIGRIAFTAEASFKSVNWAIFVQSEDHKRIIPPRMMNYARTLYKNTIHLHRGSSTRSLLCYRSWTGSKWKERKEVVTHRQSLSHHYVPVSTLEECVEKVAKESGEENCSQDNLRLERTRCSTPKYLRAQEFRRFKSEGRNWPDENVQGQAVHAKYSRIPKHDVQSSQTHRFIAKEVIKK